MKRIHKNIFAVLATAFFLTACNKELEQQAAITVPAYPTGTGVGATIAANPNDSLFNRLLIRTGFATTLNDLTKTFTIFAVDNAGMKVFVNGATSGIIPLSAGDSVFSRFIAGTNTTVFPPLTTALNLPIQSAGGIAQYLILGQKLPAASIGTAFPNFPYTSQIILDTLKPAVPPFVGFVRMPIFPVRGTPYSYVNNIPITGVDQTAANGVIHRLFTIAAPPSATLKNVIAADTSLSYFRAAITRADSGSVDLGRFDSLLNYGVTNMTVLAPNNNAFRTLVYGLVYSQVFTATGSATIANTQATGAVAAGPAFIGTLPVIQVKGIIAYHLLATLTTSTITPYQPNIRVFSVNIPAAPTFVKTLVNNAFPVHPGVQVRATYTGPQATAATFTGLGTFPSGGTPYSGPAANATSIDRHAVNGVFHVIDRVLLPQ